MNKVEFYSILTKQGGNDRHTRNRHVRQSAVSLNTVKRRRTRATKKTGNRLSDHEKLSIQNKAGRTQESHKIKSDRACHPPTQQKYVHHHSLMAWYIKGT